MEIILYIAAGILIGAALGWLFAKGKTSSVVQGKYTEAYKQLSTGNDNLVSQATKLNGLGLKTKKELPKEIVNASNSNDLPEQTGE